MRRKNIADLVNLVEKDGRISESALQKPNDLKEIFIESRREEQRLNKNTKTYPMH